MPMRSPHPFRVVRAAVLTTLAFALTGCAAGASDAPPADLPSDPRAVVEPAGTPTASDAVHEPPHELVLVTDIAAVRPGHQGEMEVRHVVVGDRRRVTIELVGDVKDEHVVTADEHWWWLHPEVRRAVAVDIEWVHIDIGAVAEIGRELPAPVAEARAPLPEPDAVEIGDVIGGREVLDVERVGDDEVRLTVADLSVPVVLRRRALPADTIVEIPSGAAELRDLADALGGA